MQCFTASATGIAPSRSLKGMSGHSRSSLRSWAPHRRTGQTRPAQRARRQWRCQSTPSGSRPAAPAPRPPVPCTQSMQTRSGWHVPEPPGHQQALAYMEGKDTAASRAADQPSRRRLPPLAAAASPLPPAAVWPWALIAIIRRAATAPRCRPTVQPMALVRVALAIIFLRH